MTAPFLAYDHFTQFSYGGVGTQCGIQFYLSFGLLLCGKCGKKEITGFSMVNNAQCRGWWTK